MDRPNLSTAAQDQLKAVIEGHVIAQLTRSGQAPTYALVERDAPQGTTATTSVDPAVFQELLDGGHIKQVNSGASQNGEYSLYDLV